MTSINLLLANEIQERSTLKWVYLGLACTCEKTCLSVCSPNASLYASSTCRYLQLLASPFGQGLTFTRTNLYINSTSLLQSGTYSGCLVQQSNKENISLSFCFVIAFVGIFLVQLFVRCTSYVGRTGRRQMLSLARGCWYAYTVAHEIGGFNMTDFMKHGTLIEYFISRFDSF